MWVCPICKAQGVLRYKFKVNEFAQCKECSFVFQVSPDPEEASSKIDKYLKEKYFATYLRNKQLYQKQVEEFVREVARFGSSDLGVFCDVGCSVGLTLQSCRSYGFTPVGIEVNTDAANVARDQAKCLVLNCSVWDIDVDNLPVIGVLYLNHVLEHFCKPYDLIERFRDKMPLGSVVWINIPVINCLKKTLAKFGHYRTLALGEHFSWFNIKSLTVLLDKLGFEIVWSKQYFAEFNAKLAPLQLWCRWTGDPDALAVIARRIN